VSSTERPAAWNEGLAAKPCGLTINRPRNSALSAACWRRSTITGNRLRFVTTVPANDSSAWVSPHQSVPQNTMLCPTASASTGAASTSANEPNSPCP
jgi:hypothetical protein